MELKEFTFSELYKPHDSTSLLFLSNDQERKYKLIEYICTLFSPISNKIIFSKDNSIQEEVKNVNYTLYDQMDKKMIRELLQNQRVRIQECLEEKYDDYGILIKLSNISDYLKHKSNQYRTLIIMDEFFTKDLLKSIRDLRIFFQLKRSYGITFVLIQNNLSISSVPSLFTGIDYIFLFDDFDTDFYKRLYDHTLSYKEDDNDDSISESQFIECINKYHNLTFNRNISSNKIEDTLLYFT
jgi:hypothetical protein